ncbi:MAG: hypothetical protein IJQ12_09410 [Lachnospiraceae bacterium]|nr:hypothetical protein [Lachnospiraceae bacterium]
MSTTEMVRALAILGVFVILAVFNISNIIRHRREKKDAEAAKKREGFQIAKELKGEDTE